MHVLLMVFEKMSFWLLLFSLCSHLFYSLLLRDFPFIQLSDPVFITSCGPLIVLVSWIQIDFVVLAVSDHFLWFRHFTVVRELRFSEIVSFFFICVWLVPFLFFISLSASENMLPNSSGVLNVEP
jgi:hypothetical protein